MRMSSMLVALCASLAIGTTAASASAPPEFGRCLKHIGGRFMDAGCTVASATGGYEWYPAVGGERPLQKKHFTVTNMPERLAELETVSGFKVVCKTASASGEYVTDDTASIGPTTFTECEDQPGQENCWSPGQPRRTIVVPPFVGQLGIVRRGETAAKDKAGIELSPETGALLAEIECGDLIVFPVDVRGHVIGGVPTNVMTRTPLIKLGSAEKFVEGPLAIPETSVAGGLYERSVFFLLADQRNEEAVEVSTVN